METQGNPVQTKTRVLKKVFRFFLYSAVVLLLLLGALVALVAVYENEIKAAIVGELNKHLKSEVRVDPENIDLTVVKTFPECALRFKNVLMLEALPVKQRDTLLFATELALLFNVQDIWDGRYEIKSLFLRDALARPWVFKNGKNNYTFWQESDNGQTQESDSIRFNLNRFRAENLKVSYKDRQTLFKTEFEIKTLDLSGRFSDKAFDLNSEAEVKIGHITQRKTTFLKGKTVKFALKLAVDGPKYTFQKADISVNKTAINLNGGFVYADSLEQIQVNYTTPGLDISSAISLLPDKFRGKINEYKSDGNFYASGQLDYAAASGLSAQAVFGIKNGEITYKPLSTKASNVNLEGKFRYSKKETLLELKHVTLNLNNDKLSANCRIRNFEDPELTLSVVTAMDLTNLQRFWPIDTLTRLEGLLQIDAAISGRLSDLKSNAFNGKVDLNLNAQVQNLVAQFKNDEKVYAVQNCSLSAHDRNVEVHELKMKRGSSDINVSGSIPGMFNYLSDPAAPLVIAGTLHSQKLQLEDFLFSGSGGTQKNSEPLIPANVDFKLDASIAEFSYAKFRASDITGNLEIKNQKAMLSDMKLETLQGSAILNAFADNSKNKLNVILESRLNNINITELFTEFNNFGQATLIDKNLSGFASATVDLRGTWSNALEADYNALAANASLVVERGRLVNFTPLEGLAKYIDLNDLRDIRFSDLQSRVEIKNQTIYIPRTSIKNSALNIELWGTHTFDNVIDYHVQLLISEYLARRRKNNNDEFGPVENDSERRQSAFIRMKGPIDNPDFSYDKKGLKEKVKTDIRNEKQTIKQILKEEFGRSKNDSLKTKTKTQEAAFELEKPNGNRAGQNQKKEEPDDEDF